MLKHILPALLLASPAMGATPVIDAISGVVASQTQTITISGSGFGKHKKYRNKDTRIIAFADDTAGWQAGYLPAGDTIKLSVSQWIDTQIVISGFTGRYGKPPNVLTNGDHITIEVWNAQAKGQGASASCSAIVGAGAVTCP